MSVPNQKIVWIGERTARNGQNLYATVNLEALQQAMKTLKGSSLKMWLYLNKNREHYALELSRTACLEWGIKKDSYYDGIEELIEKGYLIRKCDGSNLYTFYESPRTENQNSDKPNDYFTEETKGMSEYQKWQYQKQKKKSENPYRNNINNTGILQNNTISDFPKRTVNHLGF